MMIEFMFLFTFCYVYLHFCNKIFRFYRFYQIDFLNVFASIIFSIVLITNIHLHIFISIILILIFALIGEIINNINIIKKEDGK